MTWQVYGLRQLNLLKWTELKCFKLGFTMNKILHLLADFHGIVLISTQITIRF